MHITRTDVSRETSGFFAVRVLCCFQLFERNRATLGLAPSPATGPPETAEDRHSETTRIIRDRAAGGAKCDPGRQKPGRRRHLMETASRPPMSFHKKREPKAPFSHTRKSKNAALQDAIPQLPQCSSAPPKSQRERQGSSWMRWRWTSRTFPWQKKASCAAPRHTRRRSSRPTAQERSSPCQ